MIYFITARDVNRVKIGWSKYPEQRLKTLQTGCPGVAVIEATIDTDQSFERELHQLFRHSRKAGEWFEITPEIEAAIEYCRTGDRAGCIRNMLKTLAPSDVPASLIEAFAELSA